MLRLILGRASSGKTTHTRKLITEKLSAGRDIILIVPEQFSFESEKAMIGLLGAKRLSEMKIMSFSSLSNYILEQYCADRKPPVTNAAKAVIMSMALEAVSDKLDIFSKCLKNKNTVCELINMTDELIQCNVTGESVFRTAEQSGNSILIKKSQEIAIISDMYEAMLTERFSDDRYIINAASQLIAQHGFFKDKTVFFDEFTGFTPQENQMISLMLTQADDVYVTCCAESIRDSSGGTGAFSYAVENTSKLINLANRLGISVAQPIVPANDFPYRNEALSFIEKGIYEPSPEIYGEVTNHVTVAAAKNIYDECDYVAMSAKKLVRETGIRYRDMVVVGRAPEYSKYLPFAFKKYGIPVFEDTRRSFDNEIIVAFTLCALTLAAEGFTSEMMFRYLKTFIAGIDSDEISILENYVYIWQIDRNGWLSDWTFHPDGFGNEFDEKSEERLKKINEIRKKVVLPILELRKELNEDEGRNCTLAVYNFLRNVHADKNLLKFALKLNNTTAYECERSWDEFMNLLSLLADTLNSRRITAKRYLELFSIMVSSSDLGSLPGGLDMITIGDADRIRVSDKKVLFVVGANEGIFPASSNQSFVLTENERRILKNLGLELNDDSIDKMRKERLRVYSTLSIPRDRLFVSYSLGSIKGESMAPSEIVTMILNILPNCRKVDVSLLPPADKVESIRSAFESATLHFNDNTPYSQSVKKFISGTEYGPMLEAAEKSAKKIPAKIENKENTTALFGRDMYISSSRVEEFHKCPFRYFCRYGLKAESAEQASFNSRLNGMLVHWVLEKLFLRFGSNGLRDMSKDERKRAVNEEVLAYITERMGGSQTLAVRLKYSIERCKKNIYEILDRLAAEFSDCRFETKDVELNIASDGTVPPYTVDIPNGGKAVLGGIVDRVDTMKSADGEKTYLRVIDYKTGGKDFKLSDILSGINMQMLLYLTCIFENGTERYGNIIPAGILYVPAKKSSNKLGRDATEEEIEKERLSQGKMKGIVLADEEVIRGMEENGGGFIIEAKIDKNGNIKGKTFDIAGFELIRKTINRVIRNMAENLHEGNIGATPLMYDKNKTACDYCEYKAVCAHEKNDPFNPVFEGDPWEAMEVSENG